jgi:hypothetical protein
MIVRLLEVAIFFLIVAVVLKVVKDLMKKN